MGRSDAKRDGNGPYANEKLSTPLCVDSELSGVSFQRTGEKRQLVTPKWTRDDTLESLAGVTQNPDTALSEWPHKLMKDDEAVDATTLEADGAAAGDLSTVCTSDSEEVISVGHSEDEASFQEPRRDRALASDARPDAIISEELVDFVQPAEEFDEGFVSSEYLQPISPGPGLPDDAAYFGHSNVMESADLVPGHFSAKRGRHSRFSGHSRGECECWPYVCTGMCDIFAKTASRRRVCFNLSGRGDVTLGEPTALDVFMVQEGLFRSAGFLI
ncbi:hypothetical protein TGDOM2_289920 [Toxoplasma gondii GAB2-2007-GAL-DOM2]|uniref:Uncharacterized protein n=9 Tax=Toxoplasma gondii TaxID=5811 RepID=B9PTL2_TOXGV|nr:hypothetical protein TGGT1_289920 [Toxoplasma gondii GT1]ESS33875.1 hypothetical protein TGVEG_289920 [Toxoplasma gondii VEG]KAF4644474.1 hypothetical protein TGRH88_014680 [Toxoplasma gondii]KFG33365.1 hypothetical protein TGP89_289920 [Toxoplasma gondii p89]KFG42485.1 hypothetical protein TGDOM2_289920 [Toxoplasma gondii GAB2-2007-GAL-DOM2]KFG53370.1 hypothetical protein TGFOU_289920 [Toxoplasma gondii FOU]KFH07341.1 hypothetical protein TGMAS_289920 [Toxoplasma gondii MAS]PUA90208.1 hy